MKREIGRALRRELRDVRVDEGLRGRILAEAARERRPRRSHALVYAAAALALMALGLGMALRWGKPAPDYQRTIVASPGDGGDNGENGVLSSLTPRPTPTAMPTPEPTPEPTEGEPLPDDEDSAGTDLSDANLFLYATAFEGGVFALESNFQYSMSLYDPVIPDDLDRWTSEPVSDAAGVARLMEGMVDAGSIEEWPDMHEEEDLPLGIWYDRVQVWLENASTQLISVDDDGKEILDAVEYRFVENGYPGNDLTLYLLDREWSGSWAAVEVLAERGEGIWDGATLWRRTTHAREGVRQLDDEAFAVAVEENLSESPLPVAVKLPVDDGGAAARYEGNMSWGDGGGEADFELDFLLVDFDGDELAIILEPQNGRSLTARVHAVEAPRMTLDAAAHPGMAGWIFSEAPDEADVIDIVDDAGIRVTFTMAEIEKLAGKAEPDDYARIIVESADGAEDEVGIVYEAEENMAAAP